MYARGLGLLSVVMIALLGCDIGSITFDDVIGGEVSLDGGNGETDTGGEDSFVPIAEDWQAELMYWPESSQQWAIQVHVFAMNASRVYVTGGPITGEYDLYKCGEFGELAHWWSSNYADCREHDGNYLMDEQPALPFVLTIHAVKATGVESHSIEISDYETYHHD